MRHPVVLQVLPSLHAGGVERGTIEMARAVVAAGGTALVASAGGRMVPELERAGATHLTLPLMTKDPLSIWLNARR
ncbi:MAG: glycosyl transferase, partial [Gluconacetobacter diazotrophicus]|nr:glycosyl transferase [Gluconacetobacter diazotrophicus]